MKNTTIEEHRVRVKNTGNVVFKKFNTLLSNDTIELDSSEIINQVWDEIDCKGCANCCKSARIEWVAEDISRISSHLGMSISKFIDTFLTKSTNISNGEVWYGKQQPCSFLDLDTNLCTIYDVRPNVCSGYPYIQNKNLIYSHNIHSNNISYCPATYRWVELMIENSKI